MSSQDLRSDTASVGPPDVESTGASTGGSFGGTAEAVPSGDGRVRHGRWRRLWRVRLWRVRLWRVRLWRVTASGKPTRVAPAPDPGPAAMADAVAELTDQLGEEPVRWRWGDLHTLTLESEAFGQSGIAPVGWVFNRGELWRTGRNTPMRWERPSIEAAATRTLTLETLTLEPGRAG